MCRCEYCLDTMVVQRKGWFLVLSPPPPQPPSFKGSECLRGVGSRTAPGRPPDQKTVSTMGIIGAHIRLFTELLGRGAGEGSLHILTAATHILKLCISVLVQSLANKALKQQAR